jgi:hypothetical protein
MTSIRDSEATPAPRAPRPRALRPRVPSLAVAVVAGLALLLGACDPQADPAAEGEAGLSEARFIAVVVDLRTAARDVAESDSASALFAAARDSILAAHDVTGEELRDFVHRTAGDVARMDAVWDTINRRLRYVPERSLQDERLLIEGGRPRN